jgi:hypothetical protein
VSTDTRSLTHTQPSPLLSPHCPRLCSNFTNALAAASPLTTHRLKEHNALLLEEKEEMAPKIELLTKQLESYQTDLKAHTDLHLLLHFQPLLPTTVSPQI